MIIEPIYSSMKGNVIVAILVAVMLCGCGEKDKRHLPQAVKVVVGTVSSNGVSYGDEYVGTVESSSTTVLSFETPGNITRLLVREGDRVVKGQLLGTVSPTTLRDSHYATEVTLLQAQDAYARMKKLHDAGVISEIKWVDVETKLRQAESAERIAREQLSHTSLYAPFSGVVTSRLADVGMNVLPDQPVYKLADVSRMDVVFSVPENDISGISVGNRAVVAVKAAQGAEYRGMVKEKGIDADDVSHTYNVRIAVSDADRRLLPGMACTVRLEKSSRSGIVIPMDVVQLDTDNTRFVWLVKNGRAYRRNVTIGEFAERGVRVLAGLVPGDRIVLTGAQKISEGMRVEEK